MFAFLNPSYFHPAVLPFPEQIQNLLSCSDVISETPMSSPKSPFDIATGTSKVSPAYSVSGKFVSNA
jgi:hypothetical protein